MLKNPEARRVTLNHKTPNRPDLLHQQVLVTKRDPLLPAEVINVHELAQVMDVMKPYTLDRLFPSNITFSPLIPSHIVEVIKQALLHRPATILEIDLNTESPENLENEKINEIKEQILSLEEGDAERGRLVEEYKRLFREKMYGEFDALHARMVKKARKALLNTFGIHTPLSKEQYLEIYVKLFSSQEFTKELNYFVHALDKTKGYLAKLFPSLKTILDLCVEEVIILKTVSRKYVGQEKPTANEPKHELSAEEEVYKSFLADLDCWSFGFLNNNLTLQVNPYAVNWQHPSETNITVMAILAHEIIHAVTAVMLTIGSQNKPEKFSKIYSASIYRTLSEALSLWIELEFVKHLIECAPIRNRDKDGAKIYKKLRNRSMHLEKDMFLAESRDSLTKDDFVVETGDVESLAYTEGLKLVSDLENNGWTPNDLPYLISSLKRVLETELGSNYLFKMLITPVSVEDELSPWLSTLRKSSYLRIRDRIRLLKPIRRHQPREA